MPRKVPEWIGEHADQKIPDHVKLRIIRRSDGKCVKCQRAFSEKLEPQMDHRPSLISGKGSHRETMIFATCDDCHSELTRQDLKERAAVNKRDRKLWKLPTKRNPDRLSVWRGMDGTLRWTGWRKGTPMPHWLKNHD